MTGVLVVDKPSGLTSHDVVARVRRALGERRIGHTGTLDPLATGVLPLVIGRATRLASLLAGEDKEYVATVRLGVATDTYDATGAPAEREFTRCAESVTRDQVEAALTTFRGTREQVPPAFSAKKVGGVASYELARRNQAIALAPVVVTVSALTLERFECPLAQIRVTCSAGFYVRSLAHELGERLGCGAHLESLRRTRAGSYTQADAVPLDLIESEGPRAALRVVPLERLLLHVPAVTLNDRGARRASHGNWLSPADVEGAFPAPLATGERSRYRLLDRAKHLIGIADQRPDGALHPVIVLV